MVVPCAKPGRCVAVLLQLCIKNLVTGRVHLAQVAIAVMICLSVLPLLRQAAGVLLLQPQASQRAAFDGCLFRVRCLEGVAAISSTSFIQVRSLEQDLQGRGLPHGQLRLGKRAAAQQTTHMYCVSA